MGFWNNVGTWFTGRNGVYKDDDLVNQAIDNLNAISKDISKELDDPLNKAITDLNSVTGMSEYVGTLSQGAFNEVTASAQDGIDFLVGQIKAKQEEMDEYEQGKWWQKGLGTISMASGKVLDGFASVFEGLGDAALTVTNWGVSAVVAAFDPERKFDDVANNSILKKAIEFDVSGTLAKPLTDNPLAAKYSFFTKDSGAASICKGIGKTAGYMLLGGQIAGAVRGAAGAENAMQVVDTGRKITNALQSTTYATSLGATVSGFGQGTETGLRSGKSFQKATLQGAVEGVVEGGSMLAAGKIGERNQLNNFVKNATKDGGTISDGAVKAMKETISSYGGFTGSLTKAGLEDGFSAGKVFKEAGGGVKGLAKGAGKLAVEDVKDIKEGAGVIKKRVSDNFHKTKGYVDTIRNGEKLTQEEIDIIEKETGKKIKDLSTTELEEWGVARKTGLAPVKGVFKTTADAALIPVKVTGAVVNQDAAIANAVGTTGIAGNTTALLTEMALGGATNAIDLKTGAGINSDRAGQQFKVTPVEEEEPGPEPHDEDTNPDGTDTNPDGTDTGNDTNPDGTDTGNDTDTNPGGGGGYPGGGGGNSGGGSQTQFRDPELTNASNTSATNSTSNTAQPNTAVNEPNTAANIVFQNNSATNTPEPNTSVNESNTAEPPTGSNGSSEIVTPADPGTNPDNPTPGATVPAPSGGTSHQGGGYTGEAGYTNPDDIPPESVEDIVEPDEIDPEYEDVSDSISSIIDGTRSNFTKLPTTNSAIHSSSSGSAVIPVIAGLSAAAAAGIGAKAYMDRKNNNDNGDDDFEAEEWTGEDNLDMEYNDGVEGEQYLDDDSDYGSEIAEPDKYGARTNDELADMQ